MGDLELLELWFSGGVDRFSLLGVYVDCDFEVNYKVFFKFNLSVFEICVD